MNGNQRHMIPRNIKSEMQIIGSFGIVSIVTVVSILMIGMTIVNQFRISGIFWWLIMFSHLLFAGYAVHKPRSNPDKIMIMVIYSMFRQDRNTYKSLDYHRYVKKEVGNE